MKNTWKMLRSRVNGFSTPVGGLNWVPPADEEALARKLIVHLEDRRVLYNHSDAESPGHCIHSVNIIRDLLSSVIVEAHSGSALDKSARAMQAACRQFLDETSKGDMREHGFSEGHYASWVFLPSLGALRARIGQAIGVVSATYKVELGSGLSSILPPEITSDAGFL